MGPPSTRGQTQGRPERTRRTKKLGPFTYDGVATIVMGLVAALVALIIWWMSIPSKPSAVSVSTTIGPTSASVATVGSKQTTVQQKQGPCIDSNGDYLSCDDGQAGFIVSSSSCATEVALAGLSVDTGLRQLDVVATTASDGQCRLIPGRAAALAGATAEDIRRLARGETVAVLSLCYATVQGPEIACSQLHTIEYIGPWVSNDVNPGSQSPCDAAARRYTSRTFDSPTEELKIIMLTRTGSYRCAVQAASPISKTVWQIGGSPLR